MVPMQRNRPTPLDLARKGLLWTGAQHSELSTSPIAAIAIRTGRWHGPQRYEARWGYDDSRLVAVGRGPFVGGSR